MLIQKISKLFSLCLSLIAIILNAQNMGVGTLNPHPSSIVEMYSKSRGLLIPRLTTSERSSISNPAHSLIIFNVETFCLEAYDSITGTWLQVSCPSACSPCDTCPLPIINSITGPSSVCPFDSIIFVVDASGGDLFIWNGPSSWTLLSQGDSAVFIAGNPGTVYVGVCNNCGCIKDSIQLSIGTAPSAVQLHNQGRDTICIYDTLHLTVVPSNLLNYNWVYHSSFTPIGTPTSTGSFTPSTTGIFQFLVSGCNGCGCSPFDTIEITVLSGSLSPVSISGPSFVCIPDTIILKASHSAATQWTWFVPQTWTVINQAGDSLVVIPDFSNGNVIVRVCDDLCNCSYDTLFIRTDSCLVFCKAFGGAQDDIGYDIALTQDGGYVIVGSTASFGQGNTDGLILKYSSSNTLQWAKSFGGAQADFFKGVTVLPDGSIVAVGTTLSFGNGGRDLYVVRVSPTGNLIWEACVGTTSIEWGHKVTTDPFGNIYIATQTHGCGAGFADVMVAKLDSSGNLKWTTVIGGNKDNVSFDISYDRNGYIVVNGGTYLNWSSGSSDMYIHKLDTAGNVIWSKTVGPGSSDRGEAVVVDASGNIYAGGSAGASWYIVKLSPAGNLLWARELSARGRIQDILIASDGTIVAIGYTNNYGQGNNDMYIVKMDTAGNMLFGRAIGGPQSDVARAGIELPNGNFIFVGETASYGSGANDVYIVKTDPSIQIHTCTTDCQTTTAGNVVGTNGSVRSGGFVSSCGTVTSVTSGQSTGGTVTNICP